MTSRLRRLSRPLLLLSLLLVGVRLRGDAYDPPASYYASAVGTGATLKSQLHNIIDGHTPLSYSATTSALAATDVDPNNSNNLLTVYDRTSINKVYSNSPLVWNREHAWPRSRGVGESGPDDSDLFNLRPALVANNGDRGNLNFGGAYGLPWGVVSDGGSKWAAGNADAGTIARQQFYMAVRYDGSDSGTTNLELFNGNPSTSQGSGDLTRLLEWHFAAPPDTFERRRNQVIYDQYQHNRSPFTDNPEMAWSVFVDQANDSRVTIGGGGASADGSSSLAVDFGRRLVGASLPATQNVTLNKTGTDGTYFRVTAAGSATSSLSGKFNAFRTNQTDSKSFAVGLSGSTATAGIKTGTVTIDNLDVTTGGGAGNGANDGNDVITATLGVVDHANASFAADMNVDELIVDLGMTLQGTASPSIDFSLYNLESTPGFTAGLDLDAIFGSGDTTALTTDLAGFDGGSTLAGGSGRAFTATLDTSTVGSFEASYALSFSDENLIGATSLAGLTLTLVGVVAPSTAIENADFNDDGFVDGADLLAWQVGYGLESGAVLEDGDADGSETVDAADLAIWQQQFDGEEATTLASALPEPTTSVLISGVGTVGLRLRRRPSATRRGRP